MLLCLWILLQHRTRKGLELNHSFDLFSHNKQQAPFKNSSFFFGGGDGDDGSSDDSGGGGGDYDEDDGGMINLFYMHGATGWRIRFDYVFSF